MAGFTGSNINLNLDEIKDSYRGDWESGSDLQNIANNIQKLLGLEYTDLAVNSIQSFSQPLIVNNLIIYDGGHVNSGNQNITVLGDLLIINGSITCNQLDVRGKIEVKRKVGDLSFVNNFTVKAMHCKGNVSFDYTNWVNSTYYEGVGANPASSDINKIGGSFTITNDESSNQNWFCCRIDITENFYCDNTTIISNFTYNQEHSFLWTIGGNCEFNGLTTLQIYDCYLSPKFSVNGIITFSESTVNWYLSGTDLTVHDYRGSGYIGAQTQITIPNGANGVSGTYNGGGSGASSGAIGVLTTGGLGAGRGGRGGNAGSLTGGGGIGGGGGAGAPDFTMFYNTGDINTTLNIYLDGGNGAIADPANAEGGEGGDGGNLSITYNATPINTVNMNVTGGAGGGSYGYAQGVNGSSGTSSHLSGGTPLLFHLPEIVTIVTLDNAETSSIEFNSPNDSNGSDLDFEIILEEELSENLWLTLINQTSNSDPSNFSGTPPYTQGSGTITYTPPALTSGKTYRIKIRAMKDSDTNLSGLWSNWLNFIYP